MDINFLQILAADNIRTLLIVASIFLAQFAKKTNDEKEIKDVKKLTLEIADRLKVSVEDVHFFEMQLRRAVADGIQYFECPTVKDVLVYKFDEFIRVMIDIYKTPWEEMNSDYAVEMITNSVKRVDDYMMKNMTGCEVALDYYQENHRDRTERLISAVMEIVEDTVNNRSERLQVKAVDFIHSTISMFYKMERDVCPKRNQT